MNVKKILCLALASAFLVFAAVGCGSKNNGTDGTTASNQSKIEVVGSTSVTPLMEKLAAKYNETNPDVKINIQGVGSSAGIKATTDGTADIGMASRELKDDEKNGIEETVIALDPIAVVVNPKNGVSALTSEQIVSIFKGEITNWSEVGGEDKPIVVISREAGSGTRDAFEEIMKLTSEKDGKTISLVKESVVADSNGAVKQNVATKENAIGYLSFGILDDTIKAVDVDSVKASAENVLNGQYKVSRPFILMTKGAANEESKKFIDFITSADGQTEIEADGYIVQK